MLLVTSERLRWSRAETLRSVYGFLGIDPTFVSDVIDQESYRSEESAAYPPIAWWLPRTVKRYVPAGKRIKEMIDLDARPRSVGARGPRPRTGCRTYL